MRADLLALTPESVAALSNVGLVKRAVREIAEGRGPTLAEEADGTVVGTFDDGVVTRLPPGRLLRDAPCSCPASGVCRHRVAVALAYPAFHGASASTRAIEAWSPGEVSDEAIERAVGKRTLEDARALERRGVLVDLSRARGDEPPTARLPACTVRFLVPRDLVYARCDCVLGQGCAHVVLAVWAFRAGDARGDWSTLTLELRAGERDERVGDEDALALALVEDVVITGVVHAREAMAQRFLLAREPLAAAGHVWTATALDDLEIALARHRARSARYRAADVVACCAEIVARGRAARAPSTALPARSILGRGEAMETKLDHLRLVSLGCRFDADDRDRSVEILLADPDTGTVVVMDKAWTFAAGEHVPDGPELSRKRLGPGTVGQLAKGQIVTRAARRRANRVLVLGTAQSGASSITPQTGDLSILPTPVRVDRLRDLEALLATRAPRLVRPRVRAEDVHAVRITSVSNVVFDAAEQTVAAVAHDADGAPLVVKRGHRRVAPHALDVLGRALLGAYGPVTWIAGPVTREATGFHIEPTMVVADRVIVPDVEDGERADLPPGRVRPVRDAIGERLEAASRVIEEIVQLGLGGPTSAQEQRLAAAVTSLAAAGLSAVSDRLERLRSGVAAIRAAPTPEALRSTARALLDAAIRLDLAHEAHAVTPGADDARSG